VIVLDTHAWVSFVSNPELLSRTAKKAVDASIEKKEVFVSSISAWEVALLVGKGRLKLTMDVIEWIGKSEKLPFLTFLPVDNAIAVKSVALPEPLHQDPADRIIIATAITIGSPVATKDQKILDYPYAKSIW
jgi:PIN domain nuclease of toxin-antitoxin system